MKSFYKRILSCVLFSLFLVNFVRPINNTTSNFEDDKKDRIHQVLEKYADISEYIKFVSDDNKLILYVDNSVDYLMQILRLVVCGG